MIPDVLVVGAGPAGRALAGEAARRGLYTTLLDAAPDAPWRTTYGSWADDLPADLPASVVATRSRGRVVAATEHRLGWDYAVLDTPVLRTHLDRVLDETGVRVRAGRAVGLVDRQTVALADGTLVRGRVVVDAGGARQPLAPGRERSAGRRPDAGSPRGPGGRAQVAAEQTAYGVVVDGDLAAGVLAAGEAVFMDWRPDHGEVGHPTFLYAIPLGAGRVLLEETSLARRPGLPMPVLARRLLARLARHGIVPPDDAPVERVLIPLDCPRHRAAGVLGFGAATPLVHPASGFNLAATLTLAPAVAHALATRLPCGADRALAAARAVLWPPAVRAVHRFRRIGLEALLRMPAEQVPAFFELFFTLPPRHPWAYLTGRADLPGTAAAMTALFAGSSWTQRARLMVPALLPAAPPSPEPP